MMSCDLCGKIAPCVQKGVSGRELDICEVCSCPLAEKVDGKGRVREALDKLEEYVETTV
jgi:hypothetical protein